MKKILFYTFCSLLTTQLIWAQLPTSAEVDKLLMRGEQFMELGNFNRAIEAFEQIEKLSDAKPPVEYYFLFGEALFAESKFSKSKEQLEQYIRMIGKDGKNYDAVLKMLLSIDDLLADMVLVEGTTFSMGSDNGGVDAYPAHSVKVNSFYIGKFEVTVRQYRAFCKVTGREMPSPPKWGWVENHPMVKVSWEDANAYCNWSNTRLPTEAEWELAAKGGKLSKDFTFSGSDDIEEVGWYDANSDGQTHPVGSKEPNELGIYDMTGNVWEWCNDWYDNNYYAKSPTDNPQGPNEGRYKVLRGGAWFFTSEYKSITYRYRLDPSYSNNLYGFRVARDVE